MDVIKLLKDDHQTVKKILEDLNNSSDRAVVKRQKLFKSVREALNIHETFEEEVLYPKLKENAKTRALTLEAYEEHHVADVLLEEIDALPEDDEQWNAKIKVLQENIEHHVEEEEKKMFPQAKKIFTDEELKQMGAELMARKETLAASA